MSTKVGDFYNGGLWGNFIFFVGSSWNFVPGYIKNVDIHHESFGSKKQVIKKLSPKSLWQTYMKWTVGGSGAFIIHFQDRPASYKEMQKILQ